MSSESEIITVVAQGTGFEVLKSVITSQSQTIDNLCKEFAGTDVTTIPLSGNISAATFERCVGFFNAHKDDNTPVPVILTDASINTVPIADEEKPVSEDDKAFFDKFDTHQMLDIITAANFLDSRRLLDTACRAMALRFLGKTPDQLYEILGVVDKLTPQEEEEVRKENPWLVDQ